MPYIPPQPLNDTAFPQSTPCAKDLETTMQLLIEKWELHFPLIDYHEIQRIPTQASTSNDFISGTVDTKVDDLWGEDIPTNLTTDWVQPHANDSLGLAIDATDGRVWGITKQINAALNLQPTERDLKKLGIDQAKGILVTIPTPLLDDKMISVATADYFIWRGERYEVIKTHKRHYWYNTNIYLYMVLDCNRLRIGS